MGKIERKFLAINFYEKLMGQEFKFFFRFLSFSIFYFDFLLLNVKDGRKGNSKKKEHTCQRVYPSF